MSIGEDLVEMSEHFSFPFDVAGYMHDGVAATASVTEVTEDPILLGSVLVANAGDDYYLSTDKLGSWFHQKCSKSVDRVSKDGHAYTFSEGSVVFPDPWDRPGRTIVTSEGQLNRPTHVVADPGNGRLRVLTPVETERLNGFDDGWTDTGMPQRKRYFCMGNALVVPMITRMGAVLDRIIEAEPPVE